MVDWRGSSRCCKKFCGGCKLLCEQHAGGQPFTPMLQLQQLQGPFRMQQQQQQRRQWIMRMQQHQRRQQ